jgi:hypothetical protein
MGAKWNHWREGVLMGALYRMGAVSWAVGRGINTGAGEWSLKLWFHL